jgi:hypothetical protein
MVICCTLVILSGTTLGRTPLSKGLVCSRDLYLTTHNIHKRQRAMSPARFESVNKRLSVYFLDSAVTGIGKVSCEASVNVHPSLMVYLSHGSQKGQVKERVSDLHKATWKWQFDRLVLLLQTHSITRVFRRQITVCNSSFP